MPRKERQAKTARVGKDLVDTGTGEILEVDDSILPAPSKLDRTKPLSDAQYALIAKLPDSEKANYMNGFQSEGWAQEDIERHYQSAHFGELRYHSSGGGGKGSPTPPKSR